MGIALKLIFEILFRLTLVSDSSSEFDRYLIAYKELQEVEEMFGSKTHTQFISVGE